MKKITDTENYRRYLSTRQVEYLLDLHNTDDTEKPLWNVFLDTFDSENLRVEFLDSYLDELSTNDKSLQDFLDDWTYSDHVSGTDNLIKAELNKVTNIYTTAENLVDLFTVDDWKTMFDIASDEVMEDLLKELN